MTAQDGFDVTLGRCTLATAFLLSVCFSIMLLRQAQERRDFARRIRAVEAELRKEFPTIFFEISSWPKQFTSIVLAGILLAESFAGVVLFAWYLVCGKNAAC